MKNRVKHVLGISGGKDSAALAIYLNKKYPGLEIEYYSCDTGEELKETYDLIKRLEVHLGKEIKNLNSHSEEHRINAEQNKDLTPFKEVLKSHGGYLPSNSARWCTKTLKLKPFEEYLVNDNPVISYVGIRGDENREGYISKKPNVQSIFPFRKNIWSEDVISKVLSNKNIPFVKSLYQESIFSNNKDRQLELLDTPLSSRYDQNTKLEYLLNESIKDFNKVVFQFLKTTKYPLSYVEDYPLIDNEDILNREDIFRILEESNVGVPLYYEKKPYFVEIDGELKKGYYSRSRSGCYFCFFQQKIEWVWLYENHPDRFEKAMAFEKVGYTWQQGESLEELSRPERIDAIKREHYLRKQRQKKNFKSPNLVDILTGSDEWEVDWEEEEGRGCAACFI